MIRLNLSLARQTLDLGRGVSVICEPLNSAVFTAARNDPTVPRLDADRGNSELVTVELVKAIARRTIVEWDGLGDQDGTPLDPDPAAINAMLDVWSLYEKFNMLFVAPYLLVRDEGNVSAPSPNGITVAAQATVKHARKRAKSVQRS